MSGVFSHASYSLLNTIVLRETLKAGQNLFVAYDPHQPGDKTAASLARAR